MREMGNERGERRNAMRSVVLLESCGVFLCLIRAESLSACLVWTHAVRPSFNRDSRQQAMCMRPSSIEIHRQAMCMRPSHISAIPQVFTKKKGKRRNG